MCLILFGWAIRHVATLRPKMFRLTRPKISQNLFRLSSGFITYIQGSSHWIRNVGQLTADGTKFECLANAICNAIVMLKYRNSYAIVTNLHTIKIWSTNLEYVRCTNPKLWWTIRICVSCKFWICPENLQCQPIYYPLLCGSNQALSVTGCHICRVSNQGTKMN